MGPLLAILIWGITLWSVIITARANGSMPRRISEAANQINAQFFITLVVVAIAFVLAQGLLGWVILRYRGRAGQRARYSHGNQLVEVGGTAVVGVVFVVLAILGQRVWANLHLGAVNPDRIKIEITGEQFAWNIRYPGADGQLNTEDDIETINQLHLPVEQVALVHLTAMDVIHSFFVPQFRIKRDAVPGTTGQLWLQPTQTGQYEIACAELCGIGHYRMKGYLTIETREAFDAWLAEKAAEE